MSFLNTYIGLGNIYFSVKNLTNNTQVQMSITDGFYSTDNKLNYQDLNMIPGHIIFTSIIRCQYDSKTSDDDDDIYKTDHNEGI
jgi:hypothetical protein